MPCWLAIFRKETERRRNEDRKKAERRMKRKKRRDGEESERLSLDARGSVANSSQWPNNASCIHVACWLASVRLGSLQLASLGSASSPSSSLRQRQEITSRFSLQPPRAPALGGSLPFLTDISDRLCLFDSSPVPRVLASPLKGWH